RAEPRAARTPAADEAPPPGPGPGGRAPRRPAGTGARAAVRGALVAHRGLPAGVAVPTARPPRGGPDRVDARHDPSRDGGGRARAPAGTAAGVRALAHRWPVGQGARRPGPRAARRGRAGPRGGGAAHLRRVGQAPRPAVAGPRPGRARPGDPRVPAAGPGTAARAVAA